MTSQTVCYCFNYTEKDIRKDFLENGRSTIMKRIMADKKDGRCNCSQTNPKGRWCIADVRQVVENISGNKPGSSFNILEKKIKKNKHERQDFWKSNSNPPDVLIVIL